MYIPVLLLFAGTTLGQYVLENFAADPEVGTNARGNVHRCEFFADTPGICEIAPGKLTIRSGDIDFSFITEFDNAGCQDLSSFNNHLIHVRISGSPEFSVAVLQNNLGCDRNILPHPQTWDIVNAADYVSQDGGHLYIPIAHFNIDKTKAMAIAFQAFRDPNAATIFSLVEIIELPLDGIPGFTMPEKKPTAPLYMSCTKPGSIGFGIDEGSLEYAQQLMEILNREGIKVTFFVLGKDLVDTGFKKFYKEASDNGHQIALHSYDNTAVESLRTIALIDDQITRSYQSVFTNIGIRSRYFRPPHGTDGALTRQRLEALIPQSTMIRWSVDIEDNIWAKDGDPSGTNAAKQTDAVARDLDKKGNLFYARFLYKPTMTEFKNFIDLAQKTGKRIMRVDQCMEDPDAPALIGARLSVGVHVGGA